MASDKQVLAFIYDRLVHRHGENPNYDYMQSLTRIRDTYVPAPTLPALDALVTALHNDPAMCRKRSPGGHPRWMLRPLCVSVAERVREALRDAVPLTPPKD